MCVCVFFVTPHFSAILFSRLSWTYDKIYCFSELKHNESKMNLIFVVVISDIRKGVRKVLRESYTGL